MNYNLATPAQDALGRATQQHVPGSLPAPTGTRGDDPAVPIPQSWVLWRADVSTIRRSGRLFNRKLTARSHRVDSTGIARADFRSNPTPRVFRLPNPAVALRNLYHAHRVSGGDRCIILPQLYWSFPRLQGRKRR